MPPISLGQPDIDTVAMSTAETDGHHKPLKVAVVGGGMCGLAVAIGLTRAGLDAKLGEIGAGVGLGPNAVRVLKELNILDEVLAAVHPEKPTPPQFRCLFGKGDHELIYDYPVGPEDDGLGIHRAAFLEALVHLVDSSRIHCNKRCMDIRAISPQRMQIFFADGTSAEADVVVGADGVRSAVRTYVVEREANADEEPKSGTKIVRAKFTNNVAYRGLVPVEQLKSIGVKIDLSDRLHCFVGESKHVLTFPIKDGTVINVVAFSHDNSIPWGARPLPLGTPWVSPRSSEELLAKYDDWGQDVCLLLGCILRPSVWSIHAIDPPLESYVRGRVALAGDAAHAMLPYLGAGAGQALEDALVLVRLLTHSQTRAENVEDVLKAYDTVRRPRANLVLAKSTQQGLIYDCFGPSGPTKEGLRADLEGKRSDVWHHDLLADIDFATAQLVQAGVFSNSN